MEQSLQALKLLLKVLHPRDAFLCNIVRTLCASSSTASANWALPIALKVAVRLTIKHGLSAHAIILWTSSGDTWSTHCGLEVSFGISSDVQNSHDGQCYLLMWHWRSLEDFVSYHSLVSLSLEAGKVQVKSTNGSYYRPRSVTFVRVR